MTKLLPRHRFHLPNGLAIFAALLLLISSVVGFEADQEMYFSGQESMPSTKADSTESDGFNETASHKPRGLNLDLLLFRRG